VNSIAEAASRERITQRCALVFEELVQTRMLGICSTVPLI